MKPQARTEARRLRREEGLAITEIAQRLDVAKSSVSNWVRDIPLTDAQQAALKAHYTHYESQHQGSRAVIRKYRALRQHYQAEGRAKAREGDPLHLAGCMLYWAEGRKSRNSLTLVNSDPQMLVFYMRFLRSCLDVTDSDIQIRISCYSESEDATARIVAYWFDLLGLPCDCLKQIIVNRRPNSSQQRGRKLNYGTCEVAVHRTSQVQHVLGAIQEYAGMDKPEWLD